MKTVFILIAIIAQPNENPIRVNVESIVFETKARCERNIENVIKQLKTETNQVVVNCFEREINKGK